MWNVTPRVDECVGEIPSPGENPADRRQWLREVMAQNWSDLGEELKTWRRHVIEAILKLEKDTVLFSHFIAINVAVGEATGDDRVVCFWPQNASITTIDVKNSGLVLCKLGIEDTHHNWENIKV